MTYPERTGKRPIANRPRVTNPPHMFFIAHGHSLTVVVLCWSKD